VRGDQNDECGETREEERMGQTAIHGDSPNERQTTTGCRSAVENPMISEELATRHPK